jgi:hypothetical protein
MNREINDHIQTEAGHNANIIMGVGEDETLGEIQLPYNCNWI